MVKFFGHSSVRVAPISALLLCFLTLKNNILGGKWFKVGVGVLILNRCMLFRVRLTRRQSIKTKKDMKAVIFQLMLENVPPLITLIFCQNLLFKLFLRDFSEVVVLEHSKLMRLFNNIPPTNASKG